MVTSGGTPCLDIYIPSLDTSKLDTSKKTHTYTKMRTSLSVVYVSRLMLHRHPYIEVFLV